MGEKHGLGILSNLWHSIVVKLHEKVELFPLTAKLLFFSSRLQCKGTLDCLDMSRIFWGRFVEFLDEKVKHGKGKENERNEIYLEDKSE